MATIGLDKLYYSKITEDADGNETTQEITTNKATVGEALLALELIMDKVLYGMDPSKVAYIVSEQAPEIAKVLMTEQERGVTILRGEGAYTGDEKKILMVAFRQKDIVQIKRTVHGMDKHAFMVVVDASTVLGGGFDDYQKGEL